MRRWSRFTLAVLALWGCQPSLAVRWADLPHMPPPDRARYPDDGAVVMLQQVEGLSVASGKGWYSEWLSHSVVAILDARGLTEGTLRCQRNTDAELVAFHARVRRPDGTIREVDARDLFIDESRASAAVESVETRTLVVPGVEVGSVVEVVCLEHEAGIYTHHIFAPRTDLPVERYEASMQVSETLRAAVYGYNTHRPIERMQKRGLTTYRWTEEKLPARAAEFAAVHWTEQGPWWNYRVLSFADSGVSQAYYKTWADVARPLAERLDLEADAADAGPKPPSTRHCAGDAACVVDTYFREVVRGPELRWPDAAFSPRRPGEAFAAGRVTGAERAVLLVRWLRGAGVPARHALLAKRFGFRVDRAFPSPDPFETLIVYLPPDAAHGRPQPMWLDPACETCRAGELAPPAVGTDALVFQAEARVLTRPEVSAEFLPVTGPKATVGEIRRRSTVSLGVQGDAAISVEDHRDALMAWFWWLYRRDRSPADVQAEAAGLVAALDPRAVLTGLVPGRFDRARDEVTETRQYSVKGMAAQAGPLLVLPLGMLEAAGSFDRPEGRARQADFSQVWPMVQTDEVVIAPPPGYTLRSLPPPLKAESGLSEVSFLATRDAEGRAVLTRRQELHPGRFPSTDDAALRAVDAQANALRRAVVVFERTTP